MNKYLSQPNLIQFKQKQGIYYGDIAIKQRNRSGKAYFAFTILTKSSNILTKLDSVTLKSSSVFTESSSVSVLFDSVLTESSFAITESSFVTARWAYKAGEGSSCGDIAVINNSKIVFYK